MVFGNKAIVMSQDGSNPINQTVAKSTTWADGTHGRKDWLKQSKRFRHRFFVSWDKMNPETSTLLGNFCLIKL